MADWSDIEFANGQTDYVGRLNTLRSRSEAVASTVEAFGGVGASRLDVVLTTGSLADSAEATGTVALGKTFVLLQVAADRACRVRLYETSAQRTADAARPAGQWPSGAHGVICDLVFTGAETLLLVPLALGCNLESVPSINIPYAARNLSGGTATVSVTFTVLRLET